MKYIPVWQYAKENNLSRQTVYRHIREHKFNEDDVVKKEVCKEILFIKKNARRK